jgi:hypothetical protein
VSSGYRKFSSRFVGDGAKPKTFASFATFAGGGRNFEAQADAEKAKVDTPKIQSASVKVAQVAKVEALEAVCAVCGAKDDLWTVDIPGDAVLVHQQCAAFLPEPEPAEPSAAYEAVSAEPSGIGAKVTIIELPRARRYQRTFGVLQTRCPDHVPVERWRQCVEDGSRFLAVWGEQAQAMGWSSADLFGLHTPPEQPHPSYSRLSRYDRTGLVWLLQGRPVVALTSDAATIRNPTGTITLLAQNNGDVSIGIPTASA